LESRTAWIVFFECVNVAAPTVALFSKSVVVVIAASAIAVLLAALLYHANS
jgi:hypothetical protein